MIFGPRRFLLALAVSLLAEKTRSQGTEVPWIASKSMANLKRVGHFPWFSYNPNYY
jgi:hypothetical protein